jgi:1,4-alpha-glucan branching enzyme
VSERAGATEAVNPFPDIRNGSSTNGNGKTRVVHFELTGAKAERVCIAGTFNDWQPGTSEMIAVGDGKWRKDLSLSPGEYEYRFVIDGKWVVDPGCPVQRPNGFGENNSVLRVAES